MKRIAITGSSGYLGSGLIRYFAASEPDVKILGLDIVPPHDPGATSSAELDMCHPEFRGGAEEFPARHGDPHGLYRAADARRAEDAANQRGGQPQRVLAATAAAGASGFWSRPAPRCSAPGRKTPCPWTTPGRVGREPSSLMRPTRSSWKKCWSALPASIRKSPPVVCGRA